MGSPVMQVLSRVALAFGRSYFRFVGWRFLAGFWADVCSGNWDHTVYLISRGRRSECRRKEIYDLLSPLALAKTIRREGRAVEQVPFRRKTCDFLCHLACGKLVERSYVFSL